MAQWYVKELSKLTQVSVQTLHHYDHIDLLKPSIRLANGYRLYSEKDLSKLQQIIALKYFGFSLSQIKVLLSSEVDMIEHFTIQSQLLEQKGQALLEASQTLKEVISDCTDDKSIPWQSVIKLIEVYRMTQNLANPWVKEFLSADDLKEYATFESEVIAKATPENKAAFEKKWMNLVDDIKSYLKQDPKSNIGVTIGKKCMDLIDGMYGRKYAHLRTKIFEKGFSEGKGLENVGLTPETVSWLDKAVGAYWQSRIDGLLSQAEKTPSLEWQSRWNELLNEIYGANSEGKSSLIDTLLHSDKVSDGVKKYLQGF